jgi:hypothetical protein
MQALAPFAGAYPSATLSVAMTGPTPSSETTVLTGVVESSNPTGVRIEGLWYSFPRDLDLRPPDRGARLELRVNARRFVTAMKVIEPAPSPAEVDRSIVRASVLKAAAHFCASRTDLALRSRQVLQVAEAWEAWVYRPAVVQQDDASVNVEPDRDERIKRQVALSSAAEFLAMRPRATVDDVLTIADDWLGWLNRPITDTSQAEDQSTSSVIAEASADTDVAETVAFKRRPAHATIGRSAQGR